MPFREKYWQILPKRIPGMLGCLKTVQVCWGVEKQSRYVRVFISSLCMLGCFEVVQVSWGVLQRSRYVGIWWFQVF